MIMKNKYLLQLLLTGTLFILISPACQKENGDIITVSQSLLLDSIKHNIVFGRVSESMKEIQFYLADKQGNDSLLGTWENPALINGSEELISFSYQFHLEHAVQRGLFLVAEYGTLRKQLEIYPPRIWVSSLYINHLVTEDALDRIWPVGSDHTSGIKAWDGKIDYLDLSTLKNWEYSLRKRNIRLSYEKGRWPLPPDLYELQINKEIEKLRSKGDDRSSEIVRAEAEENILSDRGEMLSTDDYSALYDERTEFIRKAAAPEIERLKKIRDAGMLDLFEVIEFDGAIIKNVFPYTTAITQWGLDVPESDRFKPGFGSAEKFLDVFAEMITYIKEQIGPEGDHIEFRLLCNFHFWTYGEPVIPEQKEDGSWIYHNVSFHRFREHTLDFKDVVEYVKDKQDVFAGITTDFPYELYIQAAGKQRYKRMADDLEKYEIPLRPIVTAMSANTSMKQYHEDILSFFNQLEKDISPDSYMIQSWGIHPTVQEVKESEDSNYSWLNAVNKIIQSFY